MGCRCESHLVMGNFSPTGGNVRLCSCVARSREWIYICDVCLDLTTVLSIFNNRSASPVTRIEQRPERQQGRRNSPVNIYRHLSPIATRQSPMNSNHSNHDLPLHTFLTNPHPHLRPPGRDTGSTGSSSNHPPERGEPPALPTASTSKAGSSARKQNVACDACRQKKIRCQRTSTAETVWRRSPSSDWYGRLAEADDRHSASSAWQKVRHVPAITLSNFRTRPSKGERPMMRPQDQPKGESGRERHLETSQM